MVVIDQQVNQFIGTLAGRRLNLEKTISITLHESKERDDPKLYILSQAFSVPPFCKNSVSQKMTLVEKYKLWINNQTRDLKTKLCHEISPIFQMPR